MSRLVTCGFEMQSLAASGGVEAEGQSFGTSGSPVFDTSTVRSGAASLKCVSGSTNVASWANIGGVAGRSYWVRFYFWIPSNPSVLTNFVRFSSAGDVSLAFLKILSTGVLRPTNQALANIGTASSALSTGTWHKIDFLFKQHASPASNNGTVAYWINDVQIGATVTNVDIGTAALHRVAIGNTGGVTNGIDMFFDDVAINDDQGASQNTRPAGGKIILAKPTADVSRASWTNGTGGTTNLYQAVDNTPPTGKAIATPPAATDQIRNAATSGFSTEVYVADLPARLGLATADIPTVAQAITTVAYSTADADASCGVQCYGNPTDTEAVSDTWPGPITDYPSGTWITHRGQTNYAPTIANSASQVAIRKVDAPSSGELSCAFLGIYVEYAPGLEGASVGVGTATADLLVAKPLEAAVAGSSTASGDLLVLRELGGAAVGAGTVVGDLAVVRELAGAATGSSDASGSAIVDVSLAGSSEGAGTAGATLSVAWQLAGSSVGVGTASGSLEPGVYLAGSSVGAGTASGALQVSFMLAGSATGVGTVAGDVVVARELGGSAAGTSDASGSAIVEVFLAGSLGGEGTASGALEISRELAGDAAGVGTAVGAVVVERYLAGATAGAGDASGSLGISLLLAGTSTGVGTAVGELLVTEPQLGRLAVDAQGGLGGSDSAAAVRTAESGGSVRSSG